MKNIDEAKKGLWANIHAKRKRGERPARPGEKGYPKTLDIEEAKKDTDMYTYKDESKGQVIKGKSGTFVGYTHSATKGKGANILKHNQTKKYYAAGGSSTAFTKKTTLHDTPEDAARAYHKGNLAEEEFSNEAYMGNLKPKKSAHEKFKDSMKRAGYDMDAGAKRLQDLLDRQKKEREDKEMNSTKSEEAEIDEASKKPNATTRHLRDYPVSDKDVAKPVKKPEKKKPEQGMAEENKKMKGKDPCWAGYKMIGTKEKGGRQVPNCVPVKEGISFRVLREMTKCKPSKNS